MLEKVCLGRKAAVSPIAPFPRISAVGLEGIESEMKRSFEIATTMRFGNDRNNNYQQQQQQHRNNLFVGFGPLSNPRISTLLGDSIGVLAHRVKKADLLMRLLRRKESLFVERDGVWLRSLLCSFFFLRLSCSSFKSCNIELQQLRMDCHSSTTDQSQWLPISTHAHTTSV